VLDAQTFRGGGNASRAGNGEKYLQSGQMFGDLAWKTRLSGLSDEDRAQFVSELDEAVRPYASEGRLRLVATPLCAFGLKSNETQPIEAR
jgi:hypothetical protein